MNTRYCFSLRIAVAALCLARLPVSSAFGQPSPSVDVPLTNLRAGIAQVDITPPIGTMLAGYSGRKTGATGIHDPLSAQVLVFDDGEKKAALIAVDTVQVVQSTGDAIRAAVTERTGIPGDHIMINASHTHGAPGLHLVPEHRKEVVAKIAGAATVAVSRLRPVSIGYGEGNIDFDINRRLLDENGKCIGGLTPDGIHDSRVKVLRIDDGNSVEPMAVVMHVVCHPAVFRGLNNQFSAEFPGIARAFIERNFGGRTTAMFLQGCGGDIRPNMPPIPDGLRFCRHGSEADLTWCGYSLGGEVVKVASRLRVREFLRDRPAKFTIGAAVEVLKLTHDPDRVVKSERDDVVDGKILFRICTLMIGDYLFVGLPGEPVVEYGLGIEKDLAHLGKKVVVLGYCSGNAGYIPVKHMIDEGGYEAAGRAYGHTSEQEIREGVKRLVTRVASE